MIGRICVRSPLRVLGLSRAIRTVVRTVSTSTSSSAALTRPVSSLLRSSPSLLFPVVTQPPRSWLTVAPSIAALHTEAFRLEYSRTHTCGELSSKDAGKKVRLCGWVENIRRMGAQLMFLTLRDRYGVTQLVVPTDLPAVRQTASISLQKPSAAADASSSGSPADVLASPTDADTVPLSQLSPETVICITGTVVPRPENMSNAAMGTGEIEVRVDEWVLLNESSQLPFPYNVPMESLSEDVRLRFRYLDIRKRRRLSSNLVLRSTIANTIRQFLLGEQFTEIETPTLFKSTPEGAREYIVPTKQPGKFYALPQSPQQFKQILMSAGMDRYFQIARCYRDEGGRADRQPEFTQVDLEMSFVTATHVQSVIEGLLARVWKTALNRDIPVPFPRHTFAEVIARYGSDKPDLRYPVTITDVTGVAIRTGFGMPLSKDNATEEFGDDDRPLDDLGNGLDINRIWWYDPRPTVKALVLPRFAALEKRPSWKELAELIKSRSVATSVFRVRERDWRVVSMVEDDKSNDSSQHQHSSSRTVTLPSRLHDDQRNAIAAAVGSLHADDVVILAAGAHLPTCELLGKIRNFTLPSLVRGGVFPGPASSDPADQVFNFSWVVDFPLFQPVADDDKDASLRTRTAIESTHNPFTAPHPDDFHLLGSQPLRARAQHYDVVLNGWELGGGSIRVHSAAVQQAIFEHLLGHGPQTAQFFAQLLDALRFGCPPHGGIALGFDRLMAMLCGADSIRDVIAFPKSMQGNDLMCIAPDDIPEQLLRDYHIQVCSSKVDKSGNGN